MAEGAEILQWHKVLQGYRLHSEFRQIGFLGRCRLHEDGQGVVFLAGIWLAGDQVTFSLNLLVSLQVKLQWRATSLLKHPVHPMGIAMNWGEEY